MNGSQSKLNVISIMLSLMLSVPGPVSANPADPALLEVREQAAVRKQWPADVSELARLDISELLAERWFEVEIVLFERLAVLDANTDEDLVSSQPRSWPLNISSLREPSGNTSAALSIESPYCYGYPELAIEDPIHPSRLQNEFDDQSLLEIMRQAEDQVNAAGEPAGSTAEQPALSAAQNGTAELSKQLSQQPSQQPEPAPATELEQLLIEVMAFEAELYRSSFTPLDNLTLINDVKALNRRRHLRPLIHQRWRQPVPQRDNPQPLMITTPADGPMPDNPQGLSQVEGYIAVTVSRYLHVSSRLWYHADTLGMTPIGLPVQNMPALPVPGYMELAQSRRLRSEELHYLDHPKLGLLIKIQPVVIPDALEQHKQALLNAD